MPGFKMHLARLPEQNVVAQMQAEDPNRDAEDASPSRPSYSLKSHHLLTKFLNSHLFLQE